MKILISLLSLFAIILAYQNCAQPLSEIPEDVGGFNSCDELQELSLEYMELGGNRVRIYTVPVREMQSVRWTIAGNQNPIITTSTSLDNVQLLNGSNTVNMMGTDVGCEAPSVSGNRNINLASSCNPNAVNVQASPASVNVGQSSTISISNPASVIQSTIEWKINGESDTSKNGLTSFTYTPSEDGTNTFEVNARSANCADTGVTSNQASLNVNNPGGGNPPRLTALNVLPVTANSPIRGSGMDAIYEVNRTVNSKISFDIANVSASNVSFDSPNASGNNCDNDYCYGLDLPSGNSCAYGVKRLEATNAHGSVEEDIFFYCDGSSTCRVGLLANRAVDETCVQTDVDLHVTPSQCSINDVNGTRCSTQVTTTNLTNLRPLAHPSAVIRLHYRISGTEDWSLTARSCGTHNFDSDFAYVTLEGRDFRVFVDMSGNCSGYANQEELQANATPIGDIVTATATCGNGLEQQGDRCIAQSGGGGTSCPGTTVRNCIIPSADAGTRVDGQCEFGGFQCNCSATCGSDGNWIFINSRCPGRDELHCTLEQ